MSKLGLETSQQTVGEQDFYQVDQILDSKVTPLGTEYLIKWKHYPSPRDYTWEPLQHLQDVMSLVDEFNKKKDQRIKKETQIRAHRSAKKMEEEEMKHSQADSYQSLEKPTKKRGRSAKPLYLPKIVKVNAQEEKVKQERKYVLSTSQNKDKQRLKDEPSRYLAETAMVPTKMQENRAETPQKNESQEKRWFNSGTYRLRSIFRHVIQNDKIVYLCNVESKDGDLCSLANLSEQEMMTVDIELQKKYILELLLEVSQQRQKTNTEHHIKFENSWITNQ